MLKLRFSVVIFPFGVTRFKTLHTVVKRRNNRFTKDGELHKSGKQLSLQSHIKFKQERQISCPKRDGERIIDSFGSV